MLFNEPLAFDNGVRAYAHMMPFGDGEWISSCDLHGETGRIRLEQTGREAELWQLDPTSKRGFLLQRPFPQPQRVESGSVRAVRDFVRCIETGKEPACSSDDALHALEVAVAMRESHRQGGRRVYRPRADCSLTIRSWETLSGAVPRAIQRREHPRPSPEPWRGLTISLSR